MLELVEELPMLELILHFAATPIAMGSSSTWRMLAGDNHAPDRNFLPHRFRGQAFALRDVFHFFRNDTLAGVVHLRNDGTRAHFNPRGANRRRHKATSLSTQ